MIVQFALKYMKVISNSNRATVQDSNFRVFLLFPGMFEKRPKMFGIVKWPKSLTGCLHPTSADNLPILAGIQPAGFRLKRATLSPARHAIGAWKSAPPSSHQFTGRECTASQIETPNCIRSTTHQFI